MHKWVCVERNMGMPIQNGLTVCTNLSRKCAASLGNFRITDQWMNEWTDAFAFAFKKESANLLAFLKNNNKANRFDFEQKLNCSIRFPKKILILSFFKKTLYTNTFSNNRMSFRIFSIRLESIFFPKYHFHHLNQSECVKQAVEKKCKRNCE